MTALEKLIRTASNDPAAHYRELVKEAQREWDATKEVLLFYANGMHFEERSDWNSFKMGEPPPPPELLDRGERARDILESPCPPANSVDK